MRLTDTLKSGAIRIPWPICVEGEIFDGQNIHTSDFCQRKCGNSPTCATAASKAKENLCNYGMSFFQFKIREDVITIFGVRGQNNPNTSNPNLKAALKGRLVTDQQISEWINTTERLLKMMDDEFLRRQSELLDPLHDPIRLGRQIEAIANRLIYKDSTRSFDEQFERASPDLKSLVKAAGLLSDSFDLLTIFFNPAAASFGRKTYISLHGLLRKLVSILSRSEPTEENDHPVRVFLNGQCYRQVLVYDSFKLVPFALISNAVKYSVDGVVRVDLIERQGIVEVAIESTGPLIEPDELELIFEKRARGRWASKVAAGTGVGLYLAKVVADANGFRMKVTSTKQNTTNRTSEVPLAYNRFSFELPMGAS